MRFRWFPYMHVALLCTKRWRLRRPRPASLAISLVNIVTEIRNAWVILKNKMNRKIKNKNWKNINTRITATRKIIKRTEKTKITAKKNRNKHKQKKKNNSKNKKHKRNCNLRMSFCCVIVTELYKQGVLNTYIISHLLWELLFFLVTKLLVNWHHSNAWYFGKKNSYISGIFLYLLVCCQIIRIAGSGY